MKPRILARTIQKAIKTFPAVVVTGPRQSGKTTLLKMLFPKSHRFVTLENPDIRMRAKEDPLGFLEQLNPQLSLTKFSMSLSYFPISRQRLMRTADLASGSLLVLKTSS